MWNVKTNIVKTTISQCNMTSDKFNIQGFTWNVYVKQHFMSKHMWFLDISHVKYPINNIGTILVLFGCSGEMYGRSLFCPVWITTSLAFLCGAADRTRPKALHPLSVKPLPLPPLWHYKPWWQTRWKLNRWFHVTCLRINIARYEAGNTIKVWW